MFSGDDFSRRPDFDACRDTILNIGIAGLANRGDSSIPHGDIRLHDAPVIEDNDVRDDEVRRARGTSGLRLPLAVANDLAAAEHDFIAVSREVFFDFDEQRCVAEAHSIAGGWAVEVSIGPPRDLHLPSPANPRTVAR